MNAQHKTALTTASEPRRSTRVEELERQISKLFRRLRMAVVYAGAKTDDGAVINATANARSWKSYEAVAHDIANSLRRLGVPHVSVLAEDMRLGQRLKEEKIHLAWLNSGGVQGYSSVAHGPAMLEMLGIPYIGHDPLTAATLDNKHAFKRHMKAVGVPTAPFITWHPSAGRFDPSADIAFRREFGNWTGEYVVKPVSGRASLGVHHVSRLKDVEEVARAVYDSTNNHVLIEAYLSGKEYCAAVCGPVVSHNGRLHRLKDAFVFGCIERVLEVDEKIFTSMDLKPITTDRMRQLDPFLEAPVIAALEALAHSVYREMSLETLVRLDVRADHEGRLYVLEANPKPDLKAPQDGVTSLIVEGLKRFGMSYDDLIFSLLADRVDLLFSQRRGGSEHLLTLAR